MRAALEGALAVRGAQYVYRVLTWPDGRFEYLPSPVIGEDEIQLSTAHLLMEGARQLDESNRPSS